MKLGVSMLLASLLAATAVAMAQTQTMEGHKLTSPDDLKWTAGPPSLPPGAQMTVLFGDPSKDGLFAMRFKFPKGYQIPPHTHSKPEVVTLISGAARVGMGETADPAKALMLPAGGFFAMPPGTAHYVFTDQEVVVQLNSNGPWTITYVKPEDDPRKQATGVAK